jgi:pimeloyl-ACP methyl ester carboxylesterase
MNRFLRSMFLIALAAEAVGAQEKTVRGVVVAPAETLHVSVHGRGDDVVIVPGIWSLTHAFRKVVPALVDSGFRVTIIEPLGIASSSRPPRADYSLTAQSRRIRTVLDSLGIRRAVFVGQSLGTAMLLRLEVMSPGYVAGLVSLEGDAADQAATPGLRRGLAMAAILFRVFPSERLMRRKLKSSMIDVSADRSWITPATVQAYMDPWRGRVVPTLNVYRSMASAKETILIAGRLTTMRIPVELMIGAAPHYGSLSPEGIRAFGRIPGAEITNVARTGHLLHEERPEVVVAAIVRMRARAAAARARLSPP